MPGFCRRHSADRFVPNVETLEGRLVPAGVINSSYSSLTKTLTLTAVNDLTVGNAALNHQDISITGVGTNAFKVTPNDGETINGVAAGAATVNNVKNIKLVMGVGDDTVTVENADLSGLLTFLGGDGDNFLDLNAAGGDNTVGRVSITNGDGNDTFLMENGINEITGRLTIDNGKGDGFSGFGASAGDLSGVLGAVNITNGAGESDQFECEGEQVQFGKSVTIQNGSGRTSFEFRAATVNSIGGTLTIVNGDGFDQAFFGSGGTGSVSVDAVSIRNGTGGSQTVFQGNTHTISGDLFISNGDGDDTLNCDTATSVTVTGAVTLQNGNGDCSITWNATTTTIGGLATMSSTAGDDEVTFGGTTGNWHSVKILSGNGDGDVNLATANLTITGNLTFIGGKDTDILTTFGSSVQTVTGFVIVILDNNNDAAAQGVFFQGGGTTIGGDLTIRGGDQSENVVLGSTDGSTDIGGAVLINLGNGDDDVEITDATFAAAVTIITGAGIDSIELESSDDGVGTTFNGPVTVLGGSGDDTLFVGTDNSGDFVTFSAGPVKFDGGAGLDTLDRLTVSNVFPAGNPIELNWETII